MMKRMLLFAFLALALFFARADESDYVLTLDVPEDADFSILQLTDTHLSAFGNMDRHLKFIAGTVEAARPDLIVLTGDMFEMASRKTADRLFSLIDRFGIPWTYIFGNHDEGGLLTAGAILDSLKANSQNCLFRNVPDDVYGDSNFAIHLNRNGVLFRQLLFMDSNRYQLSEYVGYDYVKPDQIDWYARMVDYARGLAGGRLVPSVLFLHIPLPEWMDAWRAVLRGDRDAQLISGALRETISAPTVNSGLFDRILEKGATDAVCAGHDHMNDFVIRYKGVYLAYGVHSAALSYHLDDLLGGRLITIRADNSLAFESILRRAEEENG